jgi:hypothetical protein
VQPRPPSILQIFREPLKPGVEAEYGAIEEETARICVEMKCPHPYLGVESLTGPKEVWWFNGYESRDEIKQVEAGYENNAALMAALERNGKERAHVRADRRLHELSSRLERRPMERGSGTLPGNRGYEARSPCGGNSLRGS